MKHENLPCLNCGKPVQTPKVEGVIYYDIFCSLKCEKEYREKTSSGHNQKERLEDL